MQAVRRAFESHNPLGHQNKLHVLISEEKDVVQKFEGVSKDVREVGKFSEQWGADSEPMVQSITAVLNKLHVQYADLFSNLSERFEEGRRFLKALRTREESLYSLKKRKSKVADDLESAKKKSKPTADMEQELQRISAQITAEEAEISKFRRQVLRDNLERKLAGLHEFSLKLDLLNKAGIAIATSIPGDSQNPNEVASGPWESAAAKQLEEAVAQLDKVAPLKFSNVVSPPPMPSNESLGPNSGVGVPMSQFDAQQTPSPTNNGYVSGEFSAPNPAYGGDFSPPVAAAQPVHGMYPAEPFDPNTYYGVQQPHISYDTNGQGNA